MVSGRIRRMFAGRCRLCGAVGRCMLKVWVGRKGSGGARDVGGDVLRLEEVPSCVHVLRGMGATAMKF